MNCTELHRTIDAKIIEIQHLSDILGEIEFHETNVALATESSGYV